MQWKDELSHDLPQMDDAHRELVERLAALAAAPRDALGARLDEFIASTEAHFDEENAWMEAIGFPGCHRAEHDRALAVMREVRARLVQGDAFFVHQLVQELPAWLEHHVTTMDAALAFTLKSAGFDFERGGLPEGAAVTDCGCGGTPGDASPGAEHAEERVSGTAVGSV